MKKKLVIPLIALLLITLACLCSTELGGVRSPGGEVQISPPADTPIANIIAVKDEVQVDSTPVSEADELYENEEVGLFNGGEGLLDFGGALILRVFNKSKMGLGGVHAKPVSNASILVRMRLIFGGFTGALNKPGKSADFETPNGALISVYGTKFFIVYNQETDITTVGNFSGIIEVTAGGETVSLADDHYLRVVSDNQPSEQLEIPFTRVQFENRARQLASPIEGLSDLLTFTPASTEINNPAITLTPTQTVTLSPSPTFTHTPTDTLAPTPPDTQPPVISIDYKPRPPTACRDYNPSYVSVTADVSDESEINSMTLYWKIGDDSGLISMEKLDDLTYQATIDSYSTVGDLYIIVWGEDVMGNGSTSNELYVPIEFVDTC